MANILVIDDDESVLNFLSELLRRLGYQVTPIGDGGDGLRAARETDVNLIITDLVMPGPDSGMSLIRSLREMRQDIPLVVITGNPKSADIEECRALGISEFLTKPFEIAFIKSVVNRLLPSTRDPSAL